MAPRWNLFEKRSHFVKVDKLDNYLDKNLKKQRTPYLIRLFY